MSASVNPLKKEKLIQKSFFQIILNKVLKICERWNADIKDKVKQQINELGVVSYPIFFIRSTFKTWNTL